MITERQAVHLVAELAANQSGWTDDAADATVMRMQSKWWNPEAAQQAVSDVVDSWTSQGRPSWGVLHAAYETAARRLVQPRELPPASPAELTAGREAALEAYQKTRRASGREPDDEFARRVIQGIGSST